MAWKAAARCRRASRRTASQAGHLAWCRLARERLLREAGVTRIIYEPWAISGDLPEPDELLRKRPELADDPQWAIYPIGPNDGDIEADASGLKPVGEPYDSTVAYIEAHYLVD
jgi:hypothetical protein